MRQHLHPQVLGVQLGPHGEALDGALVPRVERPQDLPLLRRKPDAQNTNFIRWRFLFGDSYRPITWEPLSKRTISGGVSTTSQDGDSGHDIGHWPAGPTAIFSCRASSGHKQTVWATSGSGGHWPEAVGGSVCKARANNRQPPVYWWVSVTMGLQCGGFVWLCLWWRNPLPSQLCGCLIRRLDSSALQLAQPYCVFSQVQALL